MQTGALTNLKEMIRSLSPAAPEPGRRGAGYRLLDKGIAESPKR